VRKLVIAATLALSFVFSLGQSTALAASTPSQTIDVNGNAMFTSILGGSINGSVALSGSIAGAQLGGLRGTANFPLRDEKLSLTPTTSIVFSAERLSVGWSRFVGCDPFVGCTWESGVSTFERTSASGPVDIRLGSLRGTGTLALGTNPICVAACPPPNSSWFAPTGYSQLWGAVLSSQDAGTLNFAGQPPTIH
jgi:hypothetical protein